ncbi:MAG: hypothetical protein GF331_03005 [Chitinivibrionales bacterium]|nr:hypothetical protein [Chitinivibrionales bacterium]
MQAERRWALCGLMLLSLTAFGSAAEWFEDPDSVFVMQDDFVVAEAEDCISPSQELWQFKTDKTWGQYTGRGYLHWNGPDQRPKHTPDCDGGAYQTDLTGCAQGDKVNWIVLPIYLREGESGTYRLDVRGSRSTSDNSEFDMWVHLHGDESTRWMIKIAQARMGQWSWGDFGGLTEDKIESHKSIGQFTCSGPGVFYFYVAGRRENCNIDRVTVAKRLEHNPDGQSDVFNMDAHDPATPASQKVLLSDVNSVGVMECGMAPVARTTGRPVASRCGLLLQSGAGLEPGIVCDLFGRVVASPTSGSRGARDLNRAPGVLIMR